jgi:hypothetical protein
MRFKINETHLFLCELFVPLQPFWAITGVAQLVE